MNHYTLHGIVKFIKLGDGNKPTTFMLSYKHLNKFSNINCVTGQPSFRALTEGECIELIDYIPFSEDYTDQHGIKHRLVKFIVKEARRTNYSGYGLGSNGMSQTLPTPKTEFNVDKAYNIAEEIIKEEEQRVSLDWLDEFKDDKIKDDQEEKADEMQTMQAEE